MLFGQPVNQLGYQLWGGGGGGGDYNGKMGMNCAASMITTATTMINTVMSRQ